MTLSLPLTSTLLKFPNKGFKKLTTATAMTTSQIRTTIGWMRKKNTTARAARFLVAIFRRCMSEVQSSNVLFGRHRHHNRAWTLLFCFYEKTTRSNQVKEQFTYFLPSDQHEIITKEASHFRCISSRSFINSLPPRWRHIQRITLCKP